MQFPDGNWLAAQTTRMWLSDLGQREMPSRSFHAAIQGSHPLHHAMSCQNGIMQGHSQEVAEYDVVIRSSTKIICTCLGLQDSHHLHGVMA